MTETLTEVPSTFPPAPGGRSTPAQARTAERDHGRRVGPQRCGKDPVAFRLEFVKTDAERAVLNKVASAGSWGRPMAPGTAQGVGFHEEYRVAGRVPGRDRLHATVDTRA